MTVEPLSPPRPLTLPGKPLAIGLVLTLLGCCLLVGWVAIGYGEFSQSRRAADTEWRELAEELGKRYRTLDMEIAKLVDSRQLDMRWSEKWRSARDAFSGSYGVERQAQFAVELESLLGEIGKALDPSSPVSISLAPSEQLKSALDDYHTAIDKEAVYLERMSMKLLRVVLAIRQPVRIDLAQRLDT